MQKFNYLLWVFYVEYVLSGLSKNSITNESFGAEELLHPSPFTVSS